LTKSVLLWSVGFIISGYGL